MPDFSKTVIYAGSTTNFTKRKCIHKKRCNYPHDKRYHYKLFNMIRDNAGGIAIERFKSRSFLVIIREKMVLKKVGLCWI